MAEIDVLIKAALLHDIGKMCLRADHSLGNHSNAGANFLKKYMDNSLEAEQVSRCLRLHHAKALKTAKLLADDFSYIVYEADNIAAAADRREREDEGVDRGFDAQSCLQSVFNIFGEQTSNPVSKYYLRGLNPSDKFNYPTTEMCYASDDKYEELVNVLESNFQRAGVLDMSNGELLRILEDVMSYIPSSTNKNEVCDISLYIHSKVTAALASCMYEYFSENKIKDYKKYCYDQSGNSEFRKQDAFLLVSGDFSGIQDFIYTVPSKGALKSLRGRSFYLEIFMENYIDEILQQLGLSRANLLYTGGGHFYLLAANTDTTKDNLKKIQNACNEWLLEKFGTKLYMAMGFAPCSASDLQNSGMQRNVFAAVSKKLNQDKLCRYDIQNLAKLFDSDSSYNKNLDGSRECAVCHMSSKKLIANSDAGDICPTCKGLFQLGEKLFKANRHFAVLSKAVGEELDLFGYNKPLFLAVMDEKELEENSSSLVRIYSKNKALTGRNIGTRLWLADYYSTNDKGAVMEFEDLAEQCCDGGHGIKRLGVLRADVDNLGAAFIGGFIRYGKEEPEKYATLSRYADLSRDLGMFFKLAVSKLCRGELNGFDNINQQQFSLYGLQKPVQRKVHVVYSGGDDMFIVGAWDELIELAVDIRRAFTRFTNGKLSFSAGLAMFSHGYPISKMAEITGMLESAAKSSNKMKNSIALFGFETEQKNAGSCLCCEHIYDWTTFTDKVCKEKLQFLLQHLNIDTLDNNKLKTGKAMLYRLLNLLEEKDDNMNLARFAYTLGRMQPEKASVQLQQCYNEFSQQMYKWFKDADARKQLRTALDLIIYYIRDTKEDA